MPKKILIVDDSPSIRTAVAVCLKGMGYEVDEASGGRSALDKASKGDFAMIITDQNMPGMEGLDLVPKLRQMPVYSRTPIIVLTTESSDEMKVSFRQAGASGWMNKPFSSEKMAAALGKFIPDGP